MIGACSEGVGSPEFAKKLKAFAGWHSYLESIKNTPVIVDQWQLEKLALTGLRHELFFYTPGVAKEQLGMGKSFALNAVLIGAAIHFFAIPLAIEACETNSAGLATRLLPKAPNIGR